MIWYPNRVVYEDDKGRGWFASPILNKTLELTSKGKSAEARLQLRRAVQTEPDVAQAA